MNKKKAIIIFSLIGLIIAYFALSSLYLSKVGYYGDIEVKLANNNDQLTALSPLNQDLEFVETGNTYSYDFKRFYKSIALVSENNSNPEELILSIKSKGEPIPYSIELVNENNDGFVYEIQIEEQQSFFYKHYLFIEFLFAKFKFIILSLIAVLATGLVYYKRKKLKTFSDNLLLKTKTIFDIGTKTRRIIFSIFITVVSLILAIFYFNNSDNLNSKNLNNEVVIESGRDQYDYHTIAANFSEKGVFPINGKIDDSIDYKINTENKRNEKFNIELFTGNRSYNRFPGYPLIISFFYKIFGVNPIYIKILQIILLLCIPFFLPILGYRLWDTKGFLAGIIAAPFLFVYLLPYTVLILPDTLTVFINFILLGLYIELRNKYKPKHVILMALLLGISFLIKASITIVLPIIILDIIILAKKKGLKQNYYKPLLFLGIFLLCWLPYNIWSVKSYRGTVTKCETIVQDVVCYNSGDDLGEFDNLKLPGSEKVLFNSLSESEILTFKNELEPFINETGYLPYDFSNRNYNDNIIKLAYCKIITLNDKPYFMISLISNFGGLECHNEYVIEKGITNDWLNDENSFYNNDNMSDKHFGLRILNFYLHKPSQLFSIAHNKLLLTKFNSEVISVFSFLFLIFVSISSFDPKRKKFLNLCFAIAPLVIIISSIVFEQITPYVFLSSLMLILIYEKKFNFNFFPGVLITINGFLYILLSFSSGRYLSYYIFPMYILSAYILVQIISTIKQQYNSRVNNNHQNLKQ